MAASLQLTGSRTLLLRLDRVAGAVTDDDARDALIAGGEPVADAARSNVRTRTGHLRDSIGVSDRLTPHQAAVTERQSRVEVYVGPGSMPEAITEEFGTFREQPHPYMRPAWDAEQARALDIIADALGARIIGAAR